MADYTFRQQRAGESRLLSYWVAGSGETVVAVTDTERPTQAHTLLADRRHVIVFTVPANVTPQKAAHQVGAAVAELGITRFDLLGEGVGAAIALWVALEPQAEIGSVVLAAPAGVPDQAFREIARPVLVLVGTEDKSDAGDRYRALLPDSNFMFVYGAERAVGLDRPEALAFITLEFFERRDLFLVSRESGIALP
jgi:pimeloyl-ACP methyl ester carboxylesterase